MAATNEFISAFRSRFRLPRPRLVAFAGTPCPRCGIELDVVGDHMASCPLLGAKPMKYQHNYVVQWCHRLNNATRIN